MMSSSATTIYSGVLTFVAIFVFSSVVLKFLAFIFPDDKKNYSEEENKET